VKLLPVHPATHMILRRICTCIQGEVESGVRLNQYDTCSLKKTAY